MSRTFPQESEMSDPKPEDGTEKNKPAEKDAFRSDGLADYGSSGQAALDGVEADKEKGKA
jgi:hypothetical protein